MARTPCRPARCRRFAPGRLALAALLVTGPVAAPAAAEGWPTFLAAPDHPARSPAVGPGEGEVLWTRAFPGERTINLQPVVGPDGTVYVGTWGAGVDEFFRGRLHAVRPDGSLAWTHDPGIAEQPVEAPHPIWGTIEGVPVVDAERGRLYFGRGDNELHAVELAGGTELWTFPTFPVEPERRPEEGGQVISPPTQGPDGTLYFGTVPYTELARTTLFAVDPDGRELWRHELDGSEGIWGSPALADDRLYVTTWDDGGKLLAFRLGEGEPPPLDWELALPAGAESFLFHPSVGPDGTVYVAGGRVTGFCDSRPLVLAVDPGGALRWFWSTSSPAEDIAYHVAVDADGSVAFGTASTQQIWPLCAGVADEGRLYRGRDEGDRFRIAWSRTAPGAVMGVALDAAGTVFAAVRGDVQADLPARLLAVDRGGSPAWPAPVAVDGEIWWSPPALDPERERLYVGTNPCADVPNLFPCLAAPELVAVGVPTGAASR